MIACVNVKVDGKKGGNGMGLVSEYLIVKLRVSLHHTHYVSLSIQAGPVMPASVYKSNVPEIGNVV